MPNIDGVDHVIDESNDNLSTNSASALDHADTQEFEAKHERSSFKNLDGDGDNPAGPNIVPRARVQIQIEDESSTSKSQSVAVVSRSNHDDSSDSYEDIIQSSDNPAQSQAPISSHQYGDSNSPTNTTTKSLSIGKKVIIGSGHILNDLCASLWFSYLLLYLQKVVQFDSDYAAGLMLLGQVVDAISTPFVGYEADNGQSCFSFCKNYGRCKSWHLFGVIMVCFSFPFIFSPTLGYDGIQDLPRIVYYGPFIAIFQIGWASTQISHLALIPKMDPDPLIRTQLIAIRYAFTVASNVTIFLLTWYSLGFSDNCEIDPTDSTIFRNVALIAIGIGLLFSLLFHIFVEEESDQNIKESFAHHKNKSEAEANQTQQNPSTSSYSRKLLSSNRSTKSHLKKRNRRRSSEDYLGEISDEARALLSSSPPLNESELLEQQRNLLINESQSRQSSHNHNNPDEGEVYFESGKKLSLSTKSLSIGQDKMTTKDWITLPQFYIVAFIYMASRLSVNLTQVYMPLYLDESLKLPCGTVATIPLTMYISGFILSLFMKLLNKYLGRQISFLIGAILSISGSLCIVLLDWNENEFLRSSGIYGVAALLGGGASALMITSLSITADLIGNNIENGAFVYGSMSFCDKLSSGFAVMFINSIVPCQKEDDLACNSSLLIPFYRKVLGYSCGSSALIGIFGVILLTYLILLNERKRISGERRISAQNMLIDSE